MCVHISRACKYVRVSIFACTYVDEKNLITVSFFFFLQPFAEADVPWSTGSATSPASASKFLSSYFPFLSYFLGDESWPTEGKLLLFYKA